MSEIYICVLDVQDLYVAVVKRTGLSKRQQPVEMYALEILRKHTKQRAR